MEKMPGLQVARGIAALCVAYFHSYVALRAFPESAQYPIPFLKEWGFLGVNFFFAISGYVICLVASRSSFTIASFAIKRIFRLYPMYWVVMAAVVALIFYGKYRVEPAGHFLYSMTLLPQSGAPAYDLSWSLEREMVFYVIAAITIPLVGVVGLAVTLATLAYAGLTLGNPWTFHVVSTTQGDFLAGVIVFLVSRNFRVHPKIPLLIFLSGSTLLVITRAHEFPFAPTISFAMILFGMVYWKTAPKFLVALGDASYSLYLTHMVLFIIAPTIAAAMHLQDKVWLCEPWRAATMFAACILSYATWRLIEQPFIRLGNRLCKD